jgi:hypothetical protein
VRKILYVIGTGDLIGVHEETKREVNFRDQAGIYVLYYGIDPIYIGQVGRGEHKGLFDRLKDHTTDRLFCMWCRSADYMSLSG